MGVGVGRTGVGSRGGGVGSFGTCNGDSGLEARTGSVSTGSVSTCSVSAGPVSSGSVSATGGVYFSGDSGAFT